MKCMSYYEAPDELGADNTETEEFCISGKGESEQYVFVIFNLLMLNFLSAVIFVVCILYQ